TIKNLDTKYVFAAKIQEQKIFGANYVTHVILKNSSANGQVVMMSIDKFIQEIQRNAINCNKVLEWVSFEDDLFDFKFLAKGGYRTVYKAKWKKGPIKYYDNNAQEWYRSGETDVVLKSINYATNFTNELFEEAIELLDEFCSFRQKDNEIWYQIESIETTMNFEIFPTETSLNYETCEQALYTSTSRRLSAHNVQDCLD
ncbi:4168_t:CDS:2, partial [Gigaspora margarita]